MVNLSRLDRRVLAGIAVLSLVLNLVPFWWGLPNVGVTSWAFDEITPEKLGKTSLDRHRGRYPPFHYQILRTAYAPVRLLVRAGVLDWDVRQTQMVLTSMGRILSSVLAVGIVLLVHRVTILAFGEARVAHLAAALLAFSPPFLYYAKTINLEAPYLFWTALSVLFFWRAIEKRRLSDYMLYGMTATLAVCTKDQAYGLYVLPSMGLWVDLARSEGRGLWRSLLDRRLLAGVAVASGVFVIVHGLIFDRVEFVHHIETLLGPETERYRLWDRTLEGFVAMSWQTVVHLAFIIGWPALALSTIGVVVAWRDKRSSLRLLLFPVSYCLFSLLVVMYHYDRFLLPVAVVTVSFAALGAVAVAVRIPVPGLKMAFLPLLVAFSLARGLTLDFMMLRDSRYLLEEWAALEKPEQSSLLTLAKYRNRAPRTHPIIKWGPMERDPGRRLKELNAEYLAWNQDEAEEIGLLELTRALRDGRLNYAELTSFQWRPPLDLVRVEGVLTNLRTINPHMVVAERIGDWSLTTAEVLARVDALWGESGEDWNALAAAVWAAPDLRGRQRLAESTVIIGHAARGRVLAGRPALVVLRNETANDIRPMLRLRLPEIESVEGVESEVRWRGGRFRGFVPAGGKVDVELALLAPGELLAAIVASGPAFRSQLQPDVERGVRIQRVR